MASAQDKPAQAQDKDRLLFLVFTVPGPTERGFFSHSACYLLQEAMRQDPAVAQAWQTEVLTLPPPGAMPMIHGDRRWERFVHEIRRRHPRVVAFSLYGWTHAASVGAARALKILAPEILLIAGGPQVADREDFVTRCDAFDVLVEGDGEAPLAALLQRLTQGRGLEGIPGVSWRREGVWQHSSVKHGGPSVPIPDVYTPNPHHLAGTAFYLSTRGCSRACKYCQWATQPLRQKEPAQILTELKAIAASPDVPCVVFFDYDLLEIYRAQGETFQQILAVLRTRPDLEVQFFTSPGNLAWEGVPALLAQLRVNRIMVGVQSLSPVALRAVNRSWAIPQLADLDRLPRGLLRQVVIELIYPLPGETPESFFGGLEHLLGLGFSRFQIFPLVVLPGTALRREAGQHGLRYVDEPPYYALETASFPGAAMDEARGVAWVLTLLGEIHALEREDLITLEAWTRDHPGLVGRLRAQVRAGQPLDEILAGLFTAIHGNAFLGLETIGDFLRVGCRNDWRRQAPVGDRTLYPPLQALTKALGAAGATVLGEHLDATTLTLQIRLSEDLIGLQLFAAQDPRPCFRVAGKLKVSYSGPLKDLAVMEALIRCVES